MSRLDTYQEISIIKETSNKRITLVRSEIDGLCYIKKELKDYRIEVWKQLKDACIPNIPQLYYLKEIDHQLIVIEEYINSPTLDEYMANHSIEEKEAKSIILQLCETLQVIHSFDPPMIHRDIKPENIFYNGKKAILFDFDISRNQDQDKKQDTTIVGSVGYASPEQYGFRQSDPRSDLYSLGVLFHILLTGKFPNEIDYQGRHKDLISQLIRIDPNNRPENIQKVVDLLNQKIDWTLPGFRSKKMVNRIIGSIGYGTILFCAYYFFSYQNDSLNKRIGVVSLWILEALLFISFVTNYCSIYNHTLFHTSTKKGVRILGIILTYLIIVVIIYIFCRLITRTTTLIGL